MHWLGVLLVPLLMWSDPQLAAGATGVVYANHLLRALNLARSRCMTQRLPYPFSVRHIMHRVSQMGPVLADAILSFRLLKVGGFLIFDDMILFPDVERAMKAFVEALGGENRLEVLHNEVRRRHDDAFHYQLRQSCL